MTTISPYRMERVRRAYIEVVGHIWMPPIQAATAYNLSDYDLENIGEFNHDNVERWLCTHAGDFQYVTDFHAVCGTTEISWATEESELQFSDCMFPPD
jgi:hypothetical protein